MASREPAPADEDTVRVPSAEETSESIRRAQRAIWEIHQRDAADAARAEEEARTERLARWQTDDLHPDQLDHADSRCGTR